MPTATASPEQIFREFSLRSRSLWRSRTLHGAFQDASAGVRLRNAFERLGGLHPLFCHFLCWRADLLRSADLLALRQVQLTAEPLPVSHVARLLRDELGAAGAALAERIDSRPLWSTHNRTAYRADHQGQMMVVQVARQPEEAEFDRLRRTLSRLAEDELAPITTPAVFEEFRRWVALAGPLDREHAYLDVLDGFRGKVTVRFPRIDPSLSSPGVLCWPWIEGAPLGDLIAAASAGALQRLSEALLEQLCILAVVDADLDLNSFVVAEDGALTLRRANRLVAIPASLVRTSLKYVSSVLSGNASAAGHNLLKLGGRAFSALDSSLYDELSSLEPELKVNMRFPPSGAVFESNFRALAKLGDSTGHARPLFLNCLHRSLIALAYWGVDARQTRRDSDFIEEAQWPVLGRLFRTRAGELASRDVASDWLIGSSLLFFEGLRQANRIAEDFRDNDFSVGVDLSGGPAEPATNGVSRWPLFAGAILLVILLFSLRWGALLAAPFSTLAAVVAVLAAAGLFWAVSRIA